MTKTAKMIPFNIETTCIKCGLHTHPGYIETNRIRSKYYPFDPAGEGKPDRPEHIQRTCTRCGYQWKEACVAEEDKES